MGDDDVPSPQAAGPPALHWLPCSIVHDGPAPVGAYFQPVANGEKERRKGERKKMHRRDSSLPLTSLSLSTLGTRSAGLDVYEAAFRGRRLLGES